LVELMEFGCVPAAPVAERNQDWFECAPQRGRRIFNTRRYFGKHLARDQSVLRQLAQLQKKNFCDISGSRR
jgi:hypothetical protein